MTDRAAVVTRSGATDPTGAIFVLNHDKADRARRRRKIASRWPSAPTRVTASTSRSTSEMPDTTRSTASPRSNMHIHHVQFDIQGSDGVSAGYAYEQSVRPYKLDGRRS